MHTFKKHKTEYCSESLSLASGSTLSCFLACLLFVSSSVKIHTWLQMSLNLLLLLLPLPLLLLLFFVFFFFLAWQQVHATDHECL
jgi:hypothetical protein